MTVYYAGIGSRATPEDVLKEMTVYAQVLYSLGLTLRSGGARGADQAFEKGSRRNEIYLPKDNNPMWTEVFNMHFHPRPDRLSPDGWNMMCRNAMQILGVNGNTPVEFVICWTKDGKASGGTGQAIRIAEAFDIPVYNLYNKRDVGALTSLLYDLYKRMHYDED